MALTPRQRRMRRLHHAAMMLAVGMVKVDTSTPSPTTLTWDGNSDTNTPSFTGTLTAPLVDDEAVLTIYSDVGLTRIVATSSNTLDASEIAGPSLSFTTGSLANGDYYAVLTHKRLGFTLGTSATATVNIRAQWLLVATRTRLPDTRTTGNKQGMSRTAHVAKDAITSVRVGWANAYFGGKGATPSTDTSVGVGVSATITASIEYPANTFTQILFSGVATGTIPDLSLLISDTATVSIPSGATFWIRCFWNSTAGIVYGGQRDAAAGDLYNVGVSGLTDQTMGGTITHNAGALPCYHPVMIAAKTTIDSYAIVGDSIAAGYLDTESTDGLRGVVARSIPSTATFLNLGQSGEKANNFLTNGPLRKLLVPYCKNIITEYGRNDKDVSGNADATIRTNILAIWAIAAPGAKKYQTTISPNTTSTDGWLTAGNQNTDTSMDAFNAWVRAGTGFTGMTGYIEVRDILDPGRVGKWLTSPSPPYTSDGLHPTSAAYALTSSAVWTNF